jgi:hypothetical protein
LAIDMCEQNKFTNNVSWLGDPWLKRITLVNAGSVPTFSAQKQATLYIKQAVSLQPIS